MARMRILVVHRRSSFTELVSERRLSRLSRLVEAADPLIANMLKAHEEHLGTMVEVRRQLAGRGLRASFRHHLEGVDIASFDLVITVGGDGTVLHASHAIAETPVLAVNSSPSTSIGFLTACTASTLSAALDRYLDGALPVTPLYRMEVRVNGVLVADRALNDVLFSHECPASTTRYVLRRGALAEPQLSSGIWVATAAGSTAVIRAAGGHPVPAGSRRLQFVVREPYGMRAGETAPVPASLTSGFVAPDEELSLRSKTLSARLYVDGPHVVFPVRFGDEVTFRGGVRPLRLAGYEKKTLHGRSAGRRTGKG